VLHFLLSFTFGHFLPPFAALRVTRRLRFWDPVPHALLHPPQPPQLETRQSTGHLLALQEAVDLEFSHFFPPFLACCVIFRVFVFEPPPQVLEHLLQEDHAECLQLTGHALVLHTAFCDVAEHLSPPNFGCVVTLRALDLMPPPHFLLHELHFAHEPILQLTGHFFVLHFCDFLSAGHFLPPLAALVVTLRLVVCVPPPHFLEHDGQPAHGDTAQSTGHFFVLHTLDWASAGHLFPPFLGLTPTDLLRLVLPPPHFLLHFDHEPQLPTLQ
jgi:hypothetical protein